GAVQLLRRCFHHFHHQRILIVESPMEQPPKIGPVAYMKQTALEGSSVLYDDLNVTMPARIAGDVPLEMRPGGEPDPQHARQPDGGARQYLARFEEVLLRPATEVRIVGLERVVLRLAADPVFLLRNDFAVHISRRVHECDEQRVTVQVLAVTLIEAVLGRVTPVARPLRDTALNGPSLTQQLAGDVTFERRGRTVALVDPDQTGSFSRRKRLHPRTPAQRRVRAVCQSRDELSGGEIERPAVITAAEGTGKLPFADRKFDTTMWAPILPRIHPVLLADEEDVIAEESY